LRHPRRQLRHDFASLGSVHAVPARNLWQGTPATETKIGSGIHHANSDTRRLDAHLLIVKRFLLLAKRTVPPI
jgi:hypothetical protein